MMDFSDRSYLMGDNFDLKYLPSDKPCKTCDNAGLETMSKVAACNCCEDYEFYIPMKGVRL